MEPLLHLIVPILILLCFFPKIDKSLIWKLGILTLLPDLDFLIPVIHRMLLHNIFFVIIVVVLLYFLIGRTASLIGAFFLMSHIIMDLVYAGVGMFWPFYKKLIYLDVGLNGPWLTETGGSLKDWVLQLGFKTMPLEAITDGDKIIPYITDVGVLIASLVVIMAIAKYVGIRIKRNKIRKEIYSPSKSIK